MSTGLLRQAATEIRRDYPDLDENPGLFMHAVADWLDKEAALTIEFDSFLALVADGKARVQSSKSTFAEAALVASAYLDGAA